MITCFFLVLSHLAYYPRNFIIILCLHYKNAFRTVWLRNCHPQTSPFLIEYRFAFIVEFIYSFQRCLLPRWKLNEGISLLVHRQFAVLCLPHGPLIFCQSELICFREFISYLTFLQDIILLIQLYNINLFITYFNFKVIYKSLIYLNIKIEQRQRSIKNCRILSVKSGIIHIASSSIIVFLLIV